MAKIYPEDVLERVRTRRRGAARRLRGRETATALAAQGLNALITAGAPEGFDDEEAHAFMSTLKNHRLRMVGYGSPERSAVSPKGGPASFAPSPNFDECDWDPRFDKEDFAELRRQGYGVADWRL